jgi:hypothetical protein
MSQTKTLKEIDKLYNDGKISLKKASELRDEYYKLPLSEKQKLLGRTDSLSSSTKSINTDIETEKKFTKNTLWGLCIICWFATSYIQGTSDFTQIIINTIAPATLAIVPTFIISKFTKNFSIILLFVLSLLILVSTILPKI